ncbi:putative cytochrome P450 77A4 [Iris pallida]|uniref:Cytochrome P450 77A4 n=1 Tax=Iris pallida TaxID=29817 RepID=A0AAX6IEV2_IRIPA|nr:putative cytochrome P450 77A4 [Iris pallida]
MHNTNTTMATISSFRFFFFFSFSSTTNNALMILLVSSLLLCMIFIFNKKIKSTAGGLLKLPPGPPGWPVVGNLFQVAFAEKPFIHHIGDLSRRYGPIFTLRMGARTLIIVSSAELAHEALVAKGQLFANRPTENPTRTIFSSNKFSVNSAFFGPEWRSLRRNMVHGMLSTTRLKEFGPVRQEAMDRFVDRLRAEAHANHGAVWVLKNARFAVFCILLAMCFGLNLDEESIVKVEQVMKKVLITLTPRMDDYLPLLRPFFLKQMKQAMEVRKEQIQTIVPLVDKRRSILANRHLHPDAVPFSYLDSLFDLKVEGRKSTPTDVELVTLCSEFLNGGTDTTAAAIEWAIARLIENPAIQSRLYEEIVGVAGETTVDEKDTEKMPYLQAFVKELLRMHPPTYFVLTHAAVDSGAKLGGYDVPKGVNLELYLPTIAGDPKLWSNPTKFDPDRFITGGETADITGVTGVRMIPFGAGRRICPGLGMGTTHITLMLARMVQAFEWRLHPSTQLDFRSKLEFTVVMERPLMAMVTPRKKKN